MATIAFTSIGATGHVYSSLGLVRELVDRGNRVVYIVPERYRSTVETAGASCEPYESGILASGTPRRLDGFRMGHIPATVAREAVAATPQIVRIMERVAPDVVVNDAFTFAGAFAAEALGLPAVRRHGSFVLSEHLDYYRDTASGALRGEMASPAALATYEATMRPFFVALSLPHRSFHELVHERAALEIVFLSRAFHPFADTYGPDVQFVGPAASATSRPPAPCDAALADPSPFATLVYISLGSVFTFQPAFFYSCIEALARVDAKVVMAVGEAFPADYWVDLPANLHVCRFAPQIEMLRRASVFVTHAGTGSVMESLDAGVPMLMVPQYPEQLVAARRAEELGAGIVLDREDVGIAALRRGVGRLLDDGSFRRAAAALGAAGRADGGAPRAADLVLDFARRRGRHEAGRAAPPVRALDGAGG